MLNSCVEVVLFGHSRTRSQTHRFTQRHTNVLGTLDHAHEHPRILTDAHTNSQAHEHAQAGADPRTRTHTHRNAHAIEHASIQAPTHTIAKSGQRRYTHIETLAHAYERTSTRRCTRKHTHTWPHADARTSRSTVEIT